MGGCVRNMKVLKKFRKLHGIKRHRHHPLIHHIHKKHKLSYSTIFYMKEYGTKSHAIATIMKESIKILIMTAMISSIGGVSLENMREKFAVLLPLFIMIPALNDMIGDFGTIVSSKFTAMLYTGKINLKKRLLESGELRKLAKIIFSIAFLSSVYLGVVSYAFAYYRGFPFDAGILAKIVAIAVLCAMILVSVIFAVSVVAGIYIYRKKEDPNNFLVPIATSVADLTSMLLFSALVLWLF